MIQNLVASGLHSTACRVGLHFWLKSVWLFGSDQEEEAGQEEGEGPEDASDSLHPALGENHLGLEGEADNKVALHGEHDDVEDGAVEGAAQQLPKDPGMEAQSAADVKGQPQEDKHVQDVHAAQAELGGSLHVTAALAEHCSPR